MLPIYQIQTQLRQAVIDNGVVVLSAPTGSGKSTQVPKMLLDTLPENGRIIVLQPRRLAARMLAERVASELNVPLGSLVGYQTRYERVVSSETRIIFITEGILTRMMIGDPALPNVSAIIFDEFHERSLNVDLGLAMASHCRQPRRPDLKLIVMSATLDIEPLAAYLPGCVQLHAEGRMYPIETLYLKPPVNPNVFLNAANALRRLLNSGLEGDVLIFMPGGYEIRCTEEECRRIQTPERLLILPLYGDMPPEQQHAVMEPADCRKVIIATNIAETSLTVPGVRHVIDSGLVRVSQFDPIRGIDMLETEKIPRTSADQRAGRAGREAPGTCQRLWTEIEQSQKPLRGIPEIGRIDLAEAVLAVNALGFRDPMAFPWFERPSENMIAKAQKLLTRLGFINEADHALTDIGRQLQNIPAHPRLSLLLFQGAQRGCFREAALAAALLTGRPLVTGAVASRPLLKQRRQNARQQKKQDDLPESDFIVQMALLEAAHDCHFQPDQCKALGIHGGAARDAWRAFEDYTRIGSRMGWATDSSDEAAFLRCILHVFPDRLAKRKDKGTLICELSGGRRAELARDSAVRDEELLIAAEMREVDGSGLQSSKLLLGLASGIREQWLWDDFPNELVDGDEVFWDESSQQVRRRLSLSCLGVLLDETLRQDPDPTAAAEMLAQRIDDGKLTLPNWDEDTEKWISRVRWLRGIMPEHPLPEYDDADIAKVHRFLCEGETSYRAVKAKSCLEAARRLLSPADVKFVETNAPAMLVLPRGRRMKIDYVPGQPPKGRARIQDIYDMTQTIRIAGGRASILMDILAPNNRTVQITEDMESFWAVQYPKIKPMLSRRYPRHEWR